MDGGNRAANTSGVHVECQANHLWREGLTPGLARQYLIGKWAFILVHCIAPGSSTWSAMYARGKPNSPPPLQVTHKLCLWESRNTNFADIQRALRYSLARLRFSTTMALSTGYGRPPVDISLIF
ncbi:unnamed protein product [Taenia asiatica]|uniref:Uncharacterized protein n=1 Tax=Taenia asiatica TaxID=60517 RepID=A0A0R3W9E6_TAEAS|nr:unnamed protein product [Taenia asiatica]